MTLAEYILNSNEDEITVTDECFDMETYFYPFDMEEKWDRSMRKFAEMLTFTKCSLNAVMGSMEGIIAGNVSEEWFERFVNTLEE